jgi:hypothetical protein
MRFINLMRGGHVVLLEEAMNLLNQSELRKFSHLIKHIDRVKNPQFLYYMFFNIIIYLNIKILKSYENF